MMPDQTTELSRRYDEILEAEHQARQRFELRREEATREALELLRTGQGKVRYLNTNGRQSEMTAGQLFGSESDSDEVLPILREVEADQRIDGALRLRVAGLFAKIAADFGEYAAENAR